MRFDLTDQEWTELEPLMPVKRKSARVDGRRIVDTILHLLRSGIPWRDLPVVYGGSIVGLDVVSGRWFFSAWQQSLAIAFT